MNTRSYPRTFAQAFPRSVEAACAIERPAPSYASTVLWIVGAAAVIGLVCFYLHGVYA